MGFSFLIKSKLNGNVIDIRGSSAAAGTRLDAFPQKATGNLFGTSSQTQLARGITSFRAC